MHRCNHRKMIKLLKRTVEMEEDQNDLPNYSGIAEVQEDNGDGFPQQGFSTLPTTSCPSTKIRRDHCVNFDLFLDLDCDRHDRVVDLTEEDEHWKRQLRQHSISCKLRNKAKERRHNHDTRRWPLADFTVLQKVAEAHREIDNYVE